MKKIALFLLLVVAAVGTTHGMFGIGRLAKTSSRGFFWLYAHSLAGFPPPASVQGFKVVDAKTKGLQELFDHSNACESSFLGVRFSAKDQEREKVCDALISQYGQNNFDAYGPETLQMSNRVASRLSRIKREFNNSYFNRRRAQERYALSTGLVGSAVMGLCAIEFCYNAYSRYKNEICEPSDADGAKDDGAKDMQ